MIPFWVSSDKHYILYRAQLEVKFEEHTTGVAQAVSELATLFPEVSVQLHDIINAIKESLQADISVLNPN